MFYPLPGSLLDQMLEAEHAAWQAERAKRPTRAAKKAFRSSLGWRRTRYAVLAENAARNGGVARCELCGCAGTPESPLHVDHIESASKNWDRRFDRTNLQVMCEACNVGKLNGPAADFRKPEAEESTEC